MLRGTLVLWAGLLTILVLHRKLHIHNWFGMVLIVAGAAIVGASRYGVLLSCMPQTQQALQAAAQACLLHMCGLVSILTISPATAASFMTERAFQNIHRPWQG